MNETVIVQSPLLRSGNSDGGAEMCEKYTVNPIVFRRSAILSLNSRDNWRRCVSRLLLILLSIFDKRHAAVISKGNLLFVIYIL